MTLDKCIFLPIGTLTGCPLCREGHPLCRLKNPTVISIWLLVGFHPATRSVQSTPADNTRKRVWQFIEKGKDTIYWFHMSFLCGATQMCLTQQLLYLRIRLTIFKDQGQSCEHWHGDFNVHSCYLIRLISGPLFL